MYKEYYLMQDEPFTSFPSPHLFYKSRSHIRAWKNLVYAIRKKEQVVMVAGEYGTGKTLLCLKMLRYMEKYEIQPRIHVPSSGFSFAMVLEKIAKALDVPVDASHAAASPRFIYEYFERYDPNKHKQIHIIIDDIQDFDHTFISELGKLVTYNHLGNFPICLYLFGHKNFFRNLDKQNLVSFKQRIRLIPLLPLNQEDVTEYIYFRLIASGASGSPVFEERAVELITQRSKGLPRLINKICDASLVIACKLKINVIGRQVVEAALAEGGLVEEGLVDFDKSEKISIPFDQMTRETENQTGHKSQQKTQFESRKIHPPPQQKEPEPEPEPDDVRDFQRSAHLFADVSGTEKTKKAHRTSGRKDLKKSAFLDGKTLTIIILIVILGLMVLFFIRDVRLTNMQPQKTNYHKIRSMISKPMHLSKTEPVQHHAVKAQKTSPPRSGRLTDSVLRPVIQEFVENTIELPLATNPGVGKLQKNIDSRTAYYEERKWITSDE